MPSNCSCRGPFDGDAAGGADELAEEHLRFGFLDPLQARGQPAVAAAGDHRQRRVQVDIEADLADQPVEVEKVDAVADGIFDAVAADVTREKIATGLGAVVGQHQRRPVAAQTGDDQFAQRHIDAANGDGSVEIADRFAAALGNVDLDLAHDLARVLV